MDLLKFTIMEKLRAEFPTIVVSDTPINNVKPQPKERKIPKLLFIEYCDDKFKQLKVVDYEDYNKYMKETIPNLDNIKLTDCTLNHGKTKAKILKWDNETGIITISKAMKNLYEYNDILEVLYKNEDTTSESNLNNEFIMCYSAYNYTKTLNKNIVEYYTRFNIDVFINDDLHNDKISEYSKRIHKLFNRDFKLIDENKEDTRKTVYVVTPLSISMSEYNINNKILRGSMLLRTYETQ